MKEPIPKSFKTEIHKTSNEPKVNEASDLKGKEKLVESDEEEKVKPTS